MAQNQRDQVKLFFPSRSSTAITTSPPWLGMGFSNQEDQDQAFSEHQRIRLRKFLMCCGCVTALLMIFVVIIIVLGFTVYNVKDPHLRMNGVTLLNGTLTNGATSNITLVADVSVKNPNAFTFRFGNSTTTAYYDGTDIGEGTTPPGKAKARRTIRFNLTMEIMTKKLLDNPNLSGDLNDQALNFNSYTRIDGKVKVLGLFKRKVVVELNCTIIYNITTRSTNYGGDNCLKRVDI